MNKAQILKLFRSSIAQYAEQFPEYSRDIDALNAVCAAFELGKLVETMRMISRLDTFVREYVPIEVDQFINLELA